MSPALSTRDKYLARRSHPEAFRFFWPVIGCPLRRPVASSFGDVDVVKMGALVSLN